MKKVVFVLPSFAGGGAERVMLKLANGLDRDHFEVSIVVLDESGPLHSEVGSHIPVHCIDRPRARTALFPLRRMLKQISPAFVVTTMGYFNLFVLLACRFGFSKTKFLVREANNLDATLRAFRYPNFVRLLYKMLYPRAAAVICPSEAILDNLAGEFAVPGTRMHVLRNPVDVTEIRKAAADSAPMSREVTYVAAGRLTEQKGFDRLLDMFAELPATSRLKILGDGPLLSSLRRQADALEISERVEFLGFRDNPWWFYAQADAFVMSSRWEGMPNAALEALACGTPVIATPESGGIGEVAAMAAVDAVRVVEAGDAFVAVLSSITHCGEPRPRPSLLPDAFKLPNVSRQFERILVSDAVA